MTASLVGVDPSSHDEEASRSARRLRTRLAWSLLLPVAFGVLLFGAVYPWTYVPLLVAVAAVGAFGWSTASARQRESLSGVASALLIILAVTLAQLIPLPAGWLARVSPHTAAIAGQYDLAFAGRAWHPMSIAPERTLLGAAMFTALAVALLGATVLISRIRVAWMIRRLTALGLALAVFGIVQKGTFNGRLYWVFSPIEIASNAFGPFVNRNHFAGWMLMTVSLAAGYLCSLVQPRGPREDSRRRRWRDRAVALASPNANRLLFAASAIGVMGLSIVWTMSRSGIGAFAIATMLLAALVSVRLRGARRAATVGLLMAVVLFALWWKGIDTVADWYSRTSTFEWRVQLWRDTAAIISDFRWFGTGLNTYGVSTLFYPMTDRSWHAMEAHSDYVQVASEGGVVLAAAAAFLVWQIARRIVRAFQEPQTAQLYWIRAGAAVALVAIGVQELSDFSLQMPGNAVLFVLVAAIALHRPRRQSAVS
jgi:O-antigen ligase